MALLLLLLVIGLIIGATKNPKRSARLMLRWMVVIIVAVLFWGAMNWAAQSDNPNEHPLGAIVVLGTRLPISVMALIKAYQKQK